MLKISGRESADTSPLLRSKYHKTVLPNGLCIVSEAIPYVRSISIGVWINVGSRDESESNNGISHFLEHMVFKGTERFTAPQIARSLERLGGYLNAFTTKEHTCYYARILDDHLRQAVDVLSDLVQNPKVPGSELEKEKGVILEELKNIEDDPDDLIHDYFDHNIFQKHPLGFPIIGRAETVKSFSRDDLFGYIHHHYVPERMVVSAAGNVDHDALVDLVGKCFHKAKNSGSHIRRSTGPRHSRPRKDLFEKPITQAHICLGTIGYGVKNRQRFTLLTLNTLLGEGMSSRLFQNIRERYGFAYSVYSFANLLSDTGNVGVYISTDTKNVDRSIELIYRELQKLRETPVSRAELARTKAQLKGSIMIGLESMSNRMMRLGSGEFYFNRCISLDEVLSSIDAVRIEDIQSVADKLFQFDLFSTVIITPMVPAGGTHKAA